MNNKRFLLERSDYDLKYEFSIADLSRVEKTKEDFWNEKEKCYMYGEFLNYLYGHNAFLTQEDADIVLNELYNENEQLKKENRQLKHWNKCLAEKRHQELKGDVE